jgi:phosphohistidine phosphatase SixA
MVVAHEPGMSATATLLCDGSAPEACRAAFKHFPTGAAAVFEADEADWSGVDWGEMRFRAFARPRDLMAASA